MLWLFLAIIARFFWAGAGAVDQLISRAHKEDTLACATILYYVMMLPFALLLLSISDWQFEVTMPYIACIALAAAVNVMALIPYYKCLQADDAHAVMAYLELTPVCLMFLAYLVFGETMRPIQLAGAGIVIVCGFIFSWDFRHGHFRARSLMLMAIAAFLFAVYQLCLRWTGQIGDMWAVGGCLLLGEWTFGMLMFLLHKGARRSIIATARETKGRTLLLSLASGAFSMTGIVMIIKAFQLAPTTGHIAALGPTQPFFSFFLAAVLGLLLPKVYSHVPFDHETKIKLFLLVGIFGGIYLLVMG